MISKVYAFLVGIDTYPNPIAPLQGCVNDIDAFENYLQGWVQNGPGCALQSPYRLTNEQATRQAVMEGFQSYLSQAQAGDVALFYYSGHGSQAPTPPEFWASEPDHVDETLVCWDSRLDGCWDLADKELASLIAKVAKTNPHILVILDCCHSGTGTRGDFQATATRRIPSDTRQRPADTFWMPPEIMQTMAMSRSTKSPSLRWILPRGRHILLAACREHEEAREFLGQGQHRGAFSYFLLETLQQSGGSLTYHELFRRTNARVRSQILSQSPQLEATDTADLHQPFLGGAIAPSRPYYTVSYHPTHGWVIDAGAVHGIPFPTDSEQPEVALFPYETPITELGKLTQAIARAAVTHVLPQLSVLQILQGQDEVGDRQNVFKAVLTAVPLPSMQVSFEGDESGIQLLRQALATASACAQASVYLREADEHTLVQLRVLAQGNEYRILRPADAISLVPALPGYTWKQAATTIGHLEQIARWMTVVELAGPTTSQLPANALQIQVYVSEEQSSEPLNQPEIRLSYGWNAVQQTWQQPTFRIKLLNQSSLTLFCALYNLTETFGIASMLDAGTVRLEPQQEVWVAQGKPIYGKVPTAQWQQGKIEGRDVLKAIACTADFDATLLDQGELGQVLRRSLSPTPQLGGTLNRLMRRIVTRQLSTVPDYDEDTYDDWTTNQVAFTIYRPQRAMTIHPEQVLNLGAGVVLGAHPTLQATAHLTSMPEATRDGRGVRLPPILQEDPSITQLLSLAGFSRNTSSSLNVLELCNVREAATVTPTHPLTLTAPISLGADEYALPIAYDGEFFLPLGIGYAVETHTEILLKRLPELEGMGTRSISGSIRIFFQKVVAQKLGLEFPYPILAAIEHTDDGTLRYDAAVASVSQRVAKAKRILLYIHGFIGDTQSIVVGTHQAQVMVKGQERSLTSLYDLELTFDYENLNTPIGDIARQLSDRLKVIGLGLQHGKMLHIIAHSMGGLVARSFIEQQGGHAIVQHLIMLGTPNAGSPWSTLQDWAITALTIGLNSLSAVAMPVKVLGSLMAAIELVDVTLDQMKPGSDFLKSLHDNTDPGVPYTVLAGDTALVSLLDAAVQNRVIQLLEKVGRTAIEFPFMSQPNDLAATVYSIHHFPSNRSPAPNLLKVACNHLNYFTDANGMEMLSKAVISTGILALDGALKDDVFEDDLLKPSVQPGAIETTVVQSKTFKFWQVGMLVLVVLGVAIAFWFYQQSVKKQKPQTTTVSHNVDTTLAHQQLN